MGRFSGRQEPGPGANARNKGVLRRHREKLRAEAVERNALTPDERRASYQRVEAERAAEASKPRRRRRATTAEA